MNYGKRFTKYINRFPDAERPSANRCSMLSYRELRTMAKNMYSVNNNTRGALNNYQRTPQAGLANMVYRALDEI